MLLGSARVSKGEEQDTQMQEVALRAVGVERLCMERASGGRWDRPELHRLLDQLRPHDVVVVWKLDRLSRSLKDLLHLMERIAQAGAGFRSLTEAIDTTTPGGRMFMQMGGSFAEFERAMIRERTQAGLVAARARGRIGGQRPKLGPLQQAEMVAMVQAGLRSQADAARLFRVPPATVSHLRAAPRQQESSPRPEDVSRPAGRGAMEASRPSVDMPLRERRPSTPWRLHHATYGFAGGGAWCWSSS
jgi:DNA invertase Pin-like site-specific DNA recombinase